MKEIILTKGFVTIIDDEDFEAVSKYKWHAAKSDDRHYATRCPKKHTHLRLHRFIMGAPEGMVVDHINGDPMDNRRCNLRICTQSQNLMNRGKTRLNTSGVKGVTWDTRARKYMAQIDENGNHHYLGTFYTIEEAAKAYAEAAEKYHGSFARLK